MATLLEQDEINRERLIKSDFDKNILVSASAGTGKTYITVERAFNILCDKQPEIKPNNIVMITFTRKAATEMKIRLNKRIRKEIAKTEEKEKIAFLEELLISLPEMQISTIHSFCQRVLKDFPLKSGVGFAPEFDSEEDGSDSRSEHFFDTFWKAGKCSGSLNAGIKREMVLDVFNTLNQHSNVQPKFIDIETEIGREFANKTIDLCKKLIESFIRKTKELDPSLFKYILEIAIKNSKNAKIDVILSAAYFIANNSKKIRNWIGSNNSKKAASAVSDLGVFFANSVTDKALETVEKLFEEIKKSKITKKENRREYILEHLDILPAEYRVCAELAEELPSDEILDSLTNDVLVLKHGIATKDALNAHKAYYEYRRKKHIVNLDDMLTLTAKLIRECQDVREKLHEQYKIFFVDEYQDTDPVQTDIIFGIVAEKYDTDWHKCMPRQGSLFLVGDAKQGIYRFRGADISLWQEAEDAIIATNGEVVHLYQNFRSTGEICEAVTKVFGENGTLCMKKDAYQAEYGEIVSKRGSLKEAVFCHEIICNDEIEGHEIAAKQIAQYIHDRVKNSQNEYKDFLLLSFNREKHMVYSDELRKRKIPVKFDGKLPVDTYLPIHLLNLRVQALCHPFDESLYFRVLCECGNISPQEWDLFCLGVKRLKEDKNLNEYISIPKLMTDVDELIRFLPETEMNNRILKVLAMLNRDITLSLTRTPCAFLEELVENCNGLFVDTYDRDEFQKQYAAILQIIDSIRAKKPLHFADMADMLQACSENSMDRMPSVRADDNFVRLMNLHKAKGLQGKIVIFLPGKPSKNIIDTNIQRKNGVSLGWFSIKESGNYQSQSLVPPEWEEHKKEEENFLKAEEVRLKYVALTRAEDEAHVFSLRIEKDGKNPKIQNVWEGFESAGTSAHEIDISEIEEVEKELNEELEKNSKLEQRKLEFLIPAITQTMIKSVTPSELNTAKPERESVEDDEETEQDKDVNSQNRPCGASWGNVVHRTAELVVTGGVLTSEAIKLSAKQAVVEQFTSELISNRERKSLRLSQNMQTLEQIHEYLIAEICKSLQFMQDENSNFRKMLEGAACYPEMPFIISVKPEDKELFKKLAPLVKLNNERRIDIFGKIDLALRYPDKTWRILDYKTDTKLEQKYENQMSIYKTILEYLTGETVIEAKLISVR